LINRSTVSYTHLDVYKRQPLKRALPAAVWLTLVLATLTLCFTPAAGAQEKPYFVTYSHDLEEPGNLDVETKTALAQPGGSTRYGATALEFEYGVRAWWTSELYLDGQATAQDSTIFTGFRIENRVRPLMRDHIVNPVLYEMCIRDRPELIPRWSAEPVTIGVADSSLTIRGGQHSVAHPKVLPPC